MFQVFPGAVGVKAETREESVGELRETGDFKVGRVQEGEDGDPPLEFPVVVVG